VQMIIDLVLPSEWKSLWDEKCHGLNVQISDDHATATRISGWGQALTFGKTPMNVCHWGKAYCVKVTKVETTWSGGLELGFSTWPPRTVAEQVSMNDTNLPRRENFMWALTSSGNTVAYKNEAVWQPTGAGVGTRVTVLVTWEKTFAVYVDDRHIGCSTPLLDIPDVRKTNFFPAIGIYGQCAGVQFVPLDPTNLAEPVAENKVGPITETRHDP